HRRRHERVSQRPARAALCALRHRLPRLHGRPAVGEDQGRGVAGPAARNSAAEISHSTLRMTVHITTRSAFVVPPSVDSKPPIAAFIPAAPSMARAIPAGLKPAAKAPTAAPNTTMKLPAPLPSSRTMVVHNVKRAVAAAMTLPAQ